MGGRSKAERVLWNYRRNVERAGELRVLLEGLMSVQGQSYSAHSVNGVSDAVSEVVHKKIELGKKIARLERDIRAVESLKDSLPIEELDTWQMLGILVNRYMEHKEPDIVMRKLGITKATYYRRNNELIARAKEYV